MYLKIARALISSRPGKSRAKYHVVWALIISGATPRQVVQAENIYDGVLLVEAYDNSI